MKRFVEARWVLFAVITAFTLTSCNKGYGCPTNFSLNDSWIDAVVSVLNVLL